MHLLYYSLLLPLATALQIPFTTSPPSPPPAPPAARLQLTLRQSVHISLHNDSQPALHRHYSPTDLHLSTLGGDPASLSLAHQQTSTWIPSSRLAFQAARRHAYHSNRIRKLGLLPSWDQMRDQELASTLEWEEHEIRMPNTSDVATIGALGRMASNAYVEEGVGSWWDLEDRWNVSDSFGWKEDGIRGHVFADPTNSTVVVAIKGTSATFIGGGGSTGKNDKTNDNLLFSCCCARVDWSWSTVCDCYSGAYTCGQDCLEHAVMTKSAYYPAATNLFNNITALYPHSQIWLTGHSLGGSLSSMLSRTYGVPSVSFEAPGDLLPSRRLHLPLPPPPSSFRQGQGSKGPEITTHVFHNADPIAMGVCNGALSSCGVAGFALETRCHTGVSIIYDVVGRLGWSVDIRTHSIKPVIEQVLIEEWGVTKEQRKKEEEEEMERVSRKKARRWGWWPLPGGGKGEEDGEEGKKPKKEPDDGQHWGRGVPAAIRQDDPEQECVECSRWEYE